MNSTRKNIICTVALLFFTSALFSQDIFTKTKMENSSLELSTFTLENGMEVFYIQDFSSALMHTVLTVKAGFSSQTPSTAGFFSLYTKLFTTAAKDISQNPFEVISVSSLCNADNSTYTAEVPPEFLYDYLNGINHCLSKGTFSDSDIKKYYSQLKEEILSYSQSTAGFINSSIDSVVFSDAPWKHDSGIYPSLFSNFSTGEVRTILNVIKKNFYTPENCSLFISGNLSKEEVYNCVSEIFSSWIQTEHYTDFAQAEKYLNEQISKQSETLKQKNSSKKFVIVSPDFTPELTQVVVQYTTLSKSECDILTWNFNETEEPKNLFIQKEKLALRSKDYITCAHAFKNKTDRLIFQSLLEKPYSLSEDFFSATHADIPSQIELFTKTIKEACRISRQNFITAQDNVERKYNDIMSASNSSIDLLSSFWSISRTNRQKFYTDFLNFAHQVYSTDEKSIYKKIQKEEPYVFVILNSQVYEENEKSFLEKGYSLITKENGSWYSKKLLANIAEENAKKILSLKEKEFPASQKNTEQPSSNFYRKNLGTIFTGKLSNNIPVAVKEIPGSKKIVLSLCIEGGENASGKNQNYLRTVLVNACTLNLQQYIFLCKEQNLIKGDALLKSWTEETASYITIETSYDNLEGILTALTQSLVFSDIQPFTADRLTSEQKYQVKIKNADLATQLKNAALKDFYAGTDFEKIFSQDSVLEKTTFHSMALSYTQLLDASLYSIVICGDTTYEKAFELSQKTIGVLKEQTQRQKAKIPEIKIKTETKNIQLQHTFKTDKTKEEAGTGVPLLIPTKNFSDPALICYAPPAEKNDMEIFNALLLYIEHTMNKTENTSGKYFTENATKEIPAGFLFAKEISSVKNFKDALEKSKKIIAEELESENASSTVKKIKALWQEKNLLKTSTLSGTALLLHKGFVRGNAAEYLENYQAVQNAEEEKFSFIFTEYFLNQSPAEYFSVDSKK